MKKEDAEEYTQSLGQIVSGSWRQIALAKRLGVPKALGVSTEDWVNLRLGGYVKMAIADRREAVAELIDEGTSNVAIAEVLGVDEKTIRRDSANADPEDTGTNKNNELEQPNSANAEPIDAVAALAADNKIRVVAETDRKRKAKEKQREDRRENNRRKISSVDSPTNLPVSGARFATIVIDPPWDFSDEGDKDQLGRARPDYAQMSISEIANLPVGELADDDSHIYLWITNRSLPKGFGLLEQWGFRYVTCLTWCKPSFGMGNYFRGQTEQVLFGVRGSQPLLRKDVGTWFSANRGPRGHSSKPVEFIDLVESCSPGPYLEMFSRVDRDDWTTWGENDAAA